MAIGRLGGGPEARPAQGNLGDTQGAERKAAASVREGASGTPAGKGMPLAGRKREMERFAAKLAAAPDRRGRLVLLQGEPGIGKTRLLEEMGARLEAEGWLTLKGRAFETERGRAYGPWIDAAWALASERRAAAEACPLLHPSGLPDTGRTDAAFLFEAVRAWLEAAAGESRLAVIVDDLHWLDPSSVALLQYLLRHPASPLDLVLCGMRSVAAAPDESVQALLTLARREAWAEGWDIGPLSAEETASLLGMAGSLRDPGQVFAESAGHPLASLALAHEGAPRSSLDSMLDERIRLAGEDGRNVLQWASLLGRSLPPALLETLTGLGVHPLLGALERLEAQGLVRTQDGKAGLEYLFGHDLIRQRIQAGLSAPRLALMHAHVAQALRRNPSLGRGWEEIAAHAEQGGQIDLAIEACLEAGYHCLQLRAHEGAMGFAARGLDLLERAPGRWAVLRQMLLLAGTAGSCLAQFPAGMDERLVRIAAEAKAAAESETMLMAINTLGVIRFTQERPEDLVEAAKAISDFRGEGIEPAAHAHHLADMAICLFATEQELPRAFRLMGEAQDVCARHGLRDGMTESGIGLVAFREGRLDEARSRMLASMKLLGAKELQSVEHYLLASRGQLELEADAPLETLRCTEQLREIYAHVKDKADAYFPDALDAVAKRLLGDPGAEALFHAALKPLRELNCKVMTSYLLLFWAERDWREGRLDDIEAFGREAIARCEPLKRATEPAWARALMGLAALRQGRRAEAEALFELTAPVRSFPRSVTSRAFRLIEELAMGLGRTL
jgi:hypothetical protein